MIFTCYNLIKFSDKLILACMSNFAQFFFDFSLRIWLLLLKAQMSRATRFQKNLISENLRELSTMLSDTAKRVRQPRSTSSASDVGFLSKRLRSEFIRYENASSKEESPL